MNTFTCDVCGKEMNETLRHLEQVPEEWHDFHPTKKTENICILCANNTKKCSICACSYPKTEMFFYKNRKYLRPECRKCRNAITRMAYHRKKGKISDF